MLKTGRSLPTLTIDANIAVWAVLPVLQEENIDSYRRFVQWRTTNTRLVSPVFWLAEATSAIRRAIFTKRILDSEGSNAVEDLFALQVESVGIDQSLCSAALNWAARLKQAKAYDAFYVALAGQLSTELWTADKRLVASAHLAGVSWVRWIGES